MWWIIPAVLVVLIIWVVATYNGFIKSKSLVDEAFSGIDIYLKKRFDLIPNLVETVKAYMKHEQDTLSEVVRLRNAGSAATTVEDKMRNDKQLSGVLSRLMVLAENYPELKADTQFLQLQNELTGLENDIAQSRKYYNGAARQYNVSVQTAPNNLVAGLFKFKPADYFEVSSDEERQAVKVDFGK